MPRFQISSMDDEKEVWRAKSVTVEGNFLVFASFAFGHGTKPAEQFKAALVALGREARDGRALSKHAWIFALDARLNDVMQRMVDNLGVDHHSFVVVDLKSQEALAYDAEKRLITEIYYKNWMA